MQCMQQLGEMKGVERSSSFGVVQRRPYREIMWMEISLPRVTSEIVFCGVPFGAWKRTKSSSNNITCHYQGRGLYDAEIPKLDIRGLLRNTLGTKKPNPTRNLPRVLFNCR